MRNSEAKNGELVVVEKSATRCGVASDNLATLSEKTPAQLRLEKKRLARAAHQRFKRPAVIAVKHSYDAGMHLTDLKALCPVGMWKEMLQELADECGMSERTAQLHMKIFRDWDQVEAIAESRGGEYPSLHEVQKLLAAKKHSSGALSRRDRAKKHGSDPHGNQASRESEWLAPELVLKATLAFFPHGITLDPASEPAATHVPADRHYTKEVDGLSDANAWVGSVFLHPPYEEQGASLWIEKLHRERDHEEFRECVLLLPVRSDDKSFEKLIQLSPSIVFVAGKLEFPDARKAPFPHLIAYVGSRHDEFAKCFSDFGPLLRPAHTTKTPSEKSEADEAQRPSLPLKPRKSPESRDLVLADRSADVNSADTPT